MANLITLEPKGKIVFAGDTHGDLWSSRYILDRYLRNGNKVVFLGDYVDRGSDSRGNVQFLLEARRRNPEYLFLLAGNHEGYKIKDFDCADFWEGLSHEETMNFAGAFSTLPLAVSVGSVIAVHGGIPDIKDMTKFDEIKAGDDNWKAITWGDFCNRKYQCFGGLRPEFSEDYFERVMQNIGKQVLIRSHDPDARYSMYGGRCVTLFSTDHPSRQRKSVAVINFDENPQIRTIDDLIIEEF